MKKTIVVMALALLSSCKTAQVEEKAPFVWEGSNLYFLLTDRFKNGDSSNDINFDRNEKTAVLRGFEGGDLRGVIQKVEDGYFTDLGINAIWMTPLVEQVHGYVDEGTGKTYGFHGYWAKDWTNLDPNFGTKKDLKELVEKAHAKGIRIVLDVVINHTGPVTNKDAQYPNNWVRTSPQCTYDNFVNTSACTLVANLPDVLTESNQPVELPAILVEKWKAEGRYEQEKASLDQFFTQYQFPRAGKYYIMKWLADYIKEFGVDGFRVDTVKHVNEDVWKEFQKVCQDAFNEYKKNNPSKVLDENPFFTVGEVYGYGISGKKMYDFGDRKVDYFANGFYNMINFDFKGDATKSYEEIFSYYSNILNNDLKGFGVMNYVTSHDDGTPFDKDRKKTFEAGTKLILSPGISQVYYGDESARNLNIPGTEGDATLRSFMNWEDIDNNPETQKLLKHYQKLGQFRVAHPSIGAGVHEKLTNNKDYWFKRTFIKGDYKDEVVIGLDLLKGEKKVNVKGTFVEGQKLNDAYSGKAAIVKNGEVVLDTDFTIVLLEKR